MSIFKRIEDISYSIAEKIGEDESQEIVDLYKYSIFMIMSEAFSFLGGLFFALLFKCVAPYIIINVVFALLRSGAGGYHCPTFASCFWVCTVLFILAGTLSIFLVDFCNITFMLSILCGIFIMPVCPKPSENSPSRGYKEDIRFRKIYRNWFILFIILSMICVHFGFFLMSSSISFSILLVAFMVSDIGEKILKSIIRLIYK